MHGFLGFMILMWILSDEDARGCVISLLFWILIAPVLWAVIKYGFLAIAVVIYLIFFRH